MSKFAASALVGALTLASANAQPASAPNAPPVCLRPNSIDHTHTTNASTIDFYMRDGKIYRNSLKGTCPGLLFHGFIYVVHGDEICSNMQSIRVIESGEICELGTFTPYTPPPRPASP
jgi:hypothetical protein